MVLFIFIIRLVLGAFAAIVFEFEYRLSKSHAMAIVSASEKILCTSP